MTDYQFGRFLAQRFSHLGSELLEAIYVSTIEPHKDVCDVQCGIIHEVGSWENNQPGRAACLRAVCGDGPWPS